MITDLRPLACALALACQTPPPSPPVQAEAPPPAAVVDLAVERQRAIALATDPLGLANAYALPDGVEGGAARGVVMCPALPGQGDGTVALSLVAPALEKGEVVLEGRVLDRRLVLAVPAGSGEVEVAFGSGLAMPVRWSGLRKGELVECDP